MRKSKILIVALVLSACLSGSSPAWTQLGPRDLVKVFPPAAPPVAAAGGTVEMPLRLEISPGYHVNAEKPTLDYLIPTRLEWTSKELKLVGMQYPPAEPYTFEFAPGKPLDVYQGVVTIRSRFQVPRGTALGKMTLRGRLRYQACDDKACYPPVNVAVEAPLEIVYVRVRREVPVPEPGKKVKN